MVRRGKRRSVNLAHALYERNSISVGPVDEPRREKKQGLRRSYMSLETKSKLKEPDRLRGASGGRNTATLFIESGSGWQKSVKDLLSARE